MAQAFSEITKEVVNRFMQNVLFVDDNAYQTDKNEKNAFDASQISSVFAKDGKLCTIFAPHSENDLSYCTSLFAKSDVIVLDWFLKLETDLVENEEADEEDDEPRGKYTKDLIREIIDDAKDEKLRLIVVYTEDGTKLYDIIKEIQSIVSDNSNYKTKEEDFRVFSSNVLILVRIKSSGVGDNPLKYNKDLQSKIVEYENLPTFISEEFANFVNGLLPNYALAAISSIRNNTSNILGVFSKDIDPAFIGHFVSIPDCNDAQSMLSKIIGTSVTNLIDTGGFNIENWIESWIDKNIKACQITINKKCISINAERLKLLVKSPDTFEKKFNNAFGIEVNEYTADLYKKETASLFCSEKSEVSNYKWARLVQHSNLFSSPSVHRLTMGTIVKFQNEKDSDWKFLLCIQQSCDSVRIGKEEIRSFLFLPLVQGIKGEAVVVGENNHLIVDNKSYSIELHKFSPINETEAQIVAQFIPQVNQYAFKDITGKLFIWVAELKEMFAQHIVSAYASQLSRVGIDNSEWIRLVGKKK